MHEIRNKDDLKYAKVGGRVKFSIVNITKSMFKKTNKFTVSLSLSHYLTPNYLTNIRKGHDRMERNIDHRLQLRSIY